MVQNQRGALPGPPQGPVSRIIAGVVAVIALLIAAVAGLVVWIVLAGVVLIGGIVLSVWFWRQRRQFEKFQKQQQPDFIDGDYTVVEEKEADQ